jgi:hypothetical protein
MYGYVKLLLRPYNACVIYTISSSDKRFLKFDFLLSMWNRQPPSMIYTRGRRHRIVALQGNETDS